MACVTFIYGAATKLPMPAATRRVSIVGQPCGKSLAIERAARRFAKSAAVVNRRCSLR